MKKIAILGSGGSIGRATLEVIRQNKGYFKVSALAVNNNSSLLEEQVVEFKPKLTAVFDESRAGELNKKLSVKVLFGDKGLEKISGAKEVDIVVVALPGAIALGAILAAIKAGKRIALANKEALVMAGGIIMSALKKSRAELIPIDSEQSAIFQCLLGYPRSQARGLYLTASGGPLYDIPEKKFKYLKLEKILNHPRWKMGKKITIDSATLMNKGLEVIEARWLFDIAVKDIKVLVHREAIVHSMVEFVDGAILAQLGATDMALPIQYALSYPSRLSNARHRLDFSKVGFLSFAAPNTKKFPCLDFAYSAGIRGGSAPTVLNAANEETVGAFLGKKINFTDIPKIIEKVMAKHRVINNPNLNEILEADNWARGEACLHF